MVQLVSSKLALDRLEARGDTNYSYPHPKPNSSSKPFRKASGARDMIKLQALSEGLVFGMSQDLVASFMRSLALGHLESRRAGNVNVYKASKLFMIFVRALNLLARDVAVLS
uniref:Ufd2P_core domain-containing protein n=1 Tax=Ascaris lumbricoides TaxID=6252 RepID=A0A0M3HNG2_ASCLU